MKAWNIQIGSGGKGLGYIKSRLEDLHGNSKSNTIIEYGYNGISNYILICCTIVDYNYKWDFIQETFRKILNDLWTWAEMEKENCLRKDLDKLPDLLNITIVNKFNSLLKEYYLTLRN